VYAKDLNTLRKRISLLIERSGFKFTFIYLKEALRLTVLHLSGSPTMKSKGVSVALDSTGFPYIIPLSLRKILRNHDLIKDRPVIVCVLTLLSIFRVFSVRTKVSLDTIIQPFSGLTRVLPLSQISLALKDLKMREVRMAKATALVLESAGPNCAKSTFGASIDAIALALNPRFLWYWMTYIIHIRGGLFFIAWLLLIVSVAAPFVLLFRILGMLPPLCLGKLSVVRDQAGKARVVAITNWWIQVGLKPLHDALFSSLRKIQMDGTFDQIAPLERLVSSVEPGQTFFSFDLSAATDRLPVDLQSQILDLLSPGLGTRWARLLSTLPWTYRGVEYQYAVGQPMGAYSSWAMLALTHHVTVQVAALRAGVPNFSSYAVLGDDIVIAQDAVAAEYVKIMEALGVPINLSKSLQSNRFAEFAKRWVGPGGVNLTPIGPGLILRTVRDTFYMPTVFLSLLELKYIQTFEQALAFIQTLPGKYQKEWVNVMWTAFGLNIPRQASQIHAQAISWSVSTMGWADFFLEPLYVSLVRLQGEIYENAKAKWSKNFEFFILNVWKTFVSRSLATRLLESLLMVFSPGLWSYMSLFYRQLFDLQQAPDFSPHVSVQGVLDLASSLPDINVANIN